MPKATQQQIDQLLTEIAKKHLSLETLETRNSDSLDFHDVAVWSLKEALQEAYEAGKARRG
jgi:phage terminase Nu1 subunit (DNA packaging protein)